jgi:hypothetical protein
MPVRKSLCAHPCAHDLAVILPSSYSLSSCERSYTIFFPASDGWNAASEFMYPLAQPRGAGAATGCHY